MEFKVAYLAGFRFCSLIFRALALAALLSGAAMAGDGQFYLGAGGGVSTIKPATRSVDVQTGFTVEDDSDGLIKLFAGYDLTDYWSIEGFYANYGTAKLTGPAQSIGGSNPSGLDNQFLTNGETIFGTVDYAIVGGQTLLQFPDNKPGLSAILKLGVSRILKNSSSNLPFTQADETRFTTGFGLEYQLKNGVAVRAEYEYQNENVQGISISALKRFGSRKVKTVPPPQALQQPKSARPAANPAPRQPRPRPAARQPQPRPQGQQANRRPPSPKVKQKPVAPAQRLSVAQPTDGDHDGVIDQLDRCPGTSPGAAVGADGCPVPAIRASSAAETVAPAGGVAPRILEGVNFRSGSAVLTPAAKRALDRIAEELAQRPDVLVTVVGHTDNVGSARRNKRLSEQRARAVAEYLATHGIDPARLSYGGKGEEMPIVSNATPEGRAMNRRVELIERPAL